MLEKEKEQFTRQLINLGESMVRIAANNASDKLLGEEELSLFKLIKDIAENEQVLYVLITDNKGMIRSHSHIDEVNKPYSPPRNIRFFREEKGMKISVITHGENEILFFEKGVTYQNLDVGMVRLAISQENIFKNLRKSRIFISVLTLVITLAAILLSLLLSMYFSRPIKRLAETTRALGKGQFYYRTRINRNDEFGDLAHAFNRMAEDLEFNEKIKGSFGRYLTPEIVEMILADPDKVWMKGSEVEASVLFVDMRGFTSISEKRNPEQVVDILNEFFTRVTDVVIRHGGHLNKFVGDEAMAIFGAPISDSRHAETAVMAALDMQEEIARFDREKTVGDVRIQAGIGINSGTMVEGNLGSQKKMEYTVIGDNVNVAARLTSLAKAGEILISKRTYESIDNNQRLTVEKRGRVPMKGRKKGITAFNVLRLNDRDYEEPVRKTLPG